MNQYLKESINDIMNGQLNNSPATSNTRVDTCFDKCSRKTVFDRDTIVHGAAPQYTEHAGNHPATTRSRRLHRRYQRAAQCRLVAAVYRQGAGQLASSGSGYSTPAAAAGPPVEPSRPSETSGGGPHQPATIKQSDFSRVGATISAAGLCMLSRGHHTRADRSFCPSDGAAIVQSGRRGKGDWWPGRTLHFTVRPLSPCHTDSAVSGAPVAGSSLRRDGPGRKSRRVRDWP